MDVKKESFVFAYYFAATTKSAEMYQDPVTISNNIGTAEIQDQGQEWWYCDSDYVTEEAFATCNSGFLAITDLENNVAPIL